MSNLYDIFAASEDLTENGKWFEFGDTIKIKIRRFKSKKSRKVREQLEAPYKRAMRVGGTISEEDNIRITNRQVAEGIIADWQGVTDRSGNILPYSPAAALKLMEELPEFRDSVVEISLSLESFREEDKTAIEGN